MSGSPLKIQKMSHPHDYNSGCPLNRLLVWYAHSNERMSAESSANLRMSENDYTIADARRIFCYFGMHTRAFVNIAFGSNIARRLCTIHLCASHVADRRPATVSKISEAYVWKARRAFGDHEDWQN